MTADQERTATIPPRAVRAHRLGAAPRPPIGSAGGGSASRDRRPASRFGMMRLTTVGRRSGQPRVAIVGYYEDGPNLVTLAMNGWADAEPAWWLNLQAQPDTIVELKDGPRAVRARVAAGPERERLWAELPRLPRLGRRHRRPRCAAIDGASGGRARASRRLRVRWPTTRPRLQSRGLTASRAPRQERETARPRQRDHREVARARRAVAGRLRSPDSRPI